MTRIIAGAASLMLLATGVLRAAEPEEPADLTSPRFERTGLSPRTRLHGFADLTALVDRVDPGDASSFSRSGLVLGAVSLYIVSALSERLSFLGEAVLETADGQSYEIDVERLVLKYAFSDRWWLAAGRHHTPFGHWNETYHHGRLLQPTIDRPVILEFEDEGGVLPVHSVGLAAGGRFFRGPWTVDYVGMVTNGRGPERTDVQNFDDANSQKATHLKLAVSRDGETQLRFGASLHLDEIPPRPAIPTRTEEMHEQIVGLHLIVREPRYEFLSEWFHIRHDEDDPAGRAFDHPGYYALFVWNRWRWKPYVGFDRFDFDAADPYFDGLEPTLKRLTLGARYDLNPFNAIKLEYRHDDRKEGSADVLAAQAAFTF